MDVVSLNLCQDEDRPIWFQTRTRTTATLEASEWNLLRELKEIRKHCENTKEQLKDLIELIGQRKVGVKEM